MNNYLSQQQINRIANICNSVFSKENKKKLKEIGNKYGLVFDNDKQTNQNLLFRVLEDKLKANTTIRWGLTKQTYAERIAGGWSYDTQLMWGTFMEQNPEYQADYGFVIGFNPEALLDTIQNVLRESFIKDANTTVNELYHIDNYEKYFSDRYGIQNIDKKARKDGERVINFFDELLAGIPNKAGFLQALNEYINGIDTTGDKAHFHNTLFQQD
jgi:hypothetical protein